MGKKAPQKCTRQSQTKRKTKSSRRKAFWLLCELQAISFTSMVVMTAKKLDIRASGKKTAQTYTASKETERTRMEVKDRRKAGLYSFGYFSEEKFIKLILTLRQWFSKVREILLIKDSRQLLKTLFIVMTKNRPQKAMNRG